jgi:hypothetical protein
MAQYFSKLLWLIHSYANNSAILQAYSSRP